MSEFTQCQWPTEESFRQNDPKKRQSNPSMYINSCRSYQDYGCWHANQWFQRGVSAYWDNTFPKYTYNTRDSAAYRTATGQVQPAMLIWNEREYRKRIWNLLQYWRRHQSDPLEWSHHMTDALLLPFASWATVILDYELGSTRPFPRRCTAPRRPDAGSERSLTGSTPQPAHAIRSLPRSGNRVRISRGVPIEV
jgi:hypothetical protein